MDHPCLTSTYLLIKKSHSVMNMLTGTRGQGKTVETQLCLPINMLFFTPDYQP